MTVEIDEHSGFCFGVVNAIRKAEQELERGELYCIGDIVHNDLEVRRLEEKGLRTIEHGEFAGLRDCRVLFRAHGEPPESYRTARENGVEVMIDDLPEYLLGMEGKTRVMIFACSIEANLSSSSIFFLRVSILFEFFSFSIAALSFCIVTNDPPCFFPANLSCFLFLILL